MRGWDLHIRGSWHYGTLEKHGTNRRFGFEFGVN